MAGLKSFKDYQRTGVVIPYPSTRKLMYTYRQQAIQRLTFVTGNIERYEKLGIDYASMLINQVFKSIMDLSRSSCIEHGFKAKGKEREEAQIAYLETFGFSKTDLEFLFDILIRLRLKSKFTKQEFQKTNEIAQKFLNAYSDRP